jgi:tRNA pseudouridine38-40 synthase
VGIVNLKLLIEYEGTAFHGWQSQKHERTVQSELEQAFRKVTGLSEIHVIGAGRTDTGVHARGQVASVSLETELAAERLLLAVNSYLGEDLRVKVITVVPDDFHARFSAVGRRYSYSLTGSRPVIGRQYLWSVRYPFDRRKLDQCARAVVGHHDFAGFCKASVESSGTLCRVEVSRWEQTDHRLIYHIIADRFLHHMVRYLVGTMVEVARGRYTVDRFVTQLEQGSGSLILHRAPAKGLVLEEVFYNRDVET